MQRTIWLPRGKGGGGELGDREAFPFPFKKQSQKKKHTQKNTKTISSLQK